MRPITAITPIPPSTRGQQGVTLIELLLVVSIMGIILAPIMMVSSHMLSQNEKLVDQNELQHEARFIMEHMSNTMRQGAEWDFDEDKLIYTQGSREGQTAFWYDQGSGRILFGEEGSYVASDFVHDFNVTSVGAENGSYQVDLQLVNARTNEQFNLRTILQGRMIQFDY